MKMHRFAAFAALFCALVAFPLRAAGEVIWSVKAVHPEGRTYDIKGIHLATTPVEGKVNGVEFAAHVKALPQAP